jgi:hypothetical protein
VAWEELDPARKTLIFMSTKGMAKSMHAALSALDGAKAPAYSLLLLTDDLSSRETAAMKARFGAAPPSTVLVTHLKFATGHTFDSSSSPANLGARKIISVQMRTLKAVIQMDGRARRREIHSSYPSNQRDIERVVLLPRAVVEEAGNPKAKFSKTSKANAKSSKTSKANKANAKPKRGREEEDASDLADRLEGLRLDDAPYRSIVRAARTRVGASKSAAAPRRRALTEWQATVQAFAGDMPTASRAYRRASPPERTPMQPIDESGAASKPARPTQKKPRPQASPKPSALAKAGASARTAVNTPQTSARLVRLVRSGKPAQAPPQAPPPDRERPPPPEHERLPSGATRLETLRALWEAAPYLGQPIPWNPSVASSALRVGFVRKLLGREINADLRTYEEGSTLVGYDRVHGIGSSRRVLHAARLARASKPSSSPPPPPPTATASPRPPATADASTQASDAAEDPGAARASDVLLPATTREEEEENQAAAEDVAPPGVTAREVRRTCERVFADAVDAERGMYESILRALYLVSYGRDAFWARRPQFVEEGRDDGADDAGKEDPTWIRKMLSEGKRTLEAAAKAGYAAYFFEPQ